MQPVRSCVEAPPRVASSAGIPCHVQRVQYAPTLASASDRVQVVAGRSSRADPRLLQAPPLTIGAPGSKDDPGALGSAPHVAIENRPYAHEERLARERLLYVRRTALGDSLL